MTPYGPGIMFTSLNQLLVAMQKSGSTRFLAKRLAPNDNSKNQIYLGGGFDALNIIPHGDIETDYKKTAGAVRRRDKAPVELYWIDSEGTGRAPEAQLILYPKYPEVRMSGFLKGASLAPKELMKSRDDGRVLFFGIKPNGAIFAYVANARSAVVSEFNAAGNFVEEGVFLNLARLVTADARSSREILLDRLLQIHQKSWIPSQRMYSDKSIRQYTASNGGGYTIEAELGIIPNGRSEPDFMGWELKQFAVNDFTRMRATSPVTLMTPEPTFGEYVNSFPNFMSAYGYPDTKGRPHRRNFGGIYRSGSAAHAITTLCMVVDGYDGVTGKIVNMGGYVALLDPLKNIAAGWLFTDLLDHWNRKHAQAAYIPSEADGAPRRYRYGKDIELGTGTDFFKFLALVNRGEVYLDPGIKIDNGKSKKRNQFRVKHNDLIKLYNKFEIVSLI
jgi:hypothetical protein